MSKELTYFSCYVVDHEEEDQFEAILASSKEDAAELYAEEKCRRWVEYPPELTICVKEEGEISWTTYNVTIRMEPLFIVTKN